MPTFDRSKRVGKTKRSSLLAVPTANVWEKTELLLQSLTANSDVFELLVSRPAADVACYTHSAKSEHEIVAGRCTLSYRSTGA